MNKDYEVLNLEESIKGERAITNPPSSCDANYACRCDVNDLDCYTRIGNR